MFNNPISYNAKISTIHIHLRQTWDYLIFTWIFRISWPKNGGVGVNRGRDGDSINPNELAFTLRVCINFPLKNCSNF